MKPRLLLASLPLAALTAQAPAHATDIGLPGNGAWSTFAVDSFLATDAGRGWIDDAGNTVRFTFVIGSGLTGMLTVLDTGFAGDMFSVVSGASPLGSTSTVPVGQYEPDAMSVPDPGLALADTRFSRATFLLGAGSYSISGVLTQSLLVGTDALDSTSGALRLTSASVAPVPEPSSLALMLAGLGVIGSIARRRLARR